MRCKIADLIVEIPEAGGLSPRCMEYQCDESTPVDIIIKQERYHLTDWPDLSYELGCYLESGFQFYGNLLRFDGIMLHASAVEYEGKAYLFSGVCGAGKSTHTGIWKSVFGDSAIIINDDKPALRWVNGRWYAYGTPWCGKDGINRNRKVPLAGICFLKQAPYNRIRRLNPTEALPKVISQSIYKFTQVQVLDMMLNCVDGLIRDIPIFELENCPNKEAALLSYQTMRQAAEEINL